MKLQVLNLAVKLHLTNPLQTELLCQYVFNLARYDQNYDIRDRARFLKQFIFPADGKPTILSKNARKIFLASKPAPLLESKYHGREQFQLGSLSHYLNIRATGYHDLPMFPEVAPDSSVRNVEVVVTNEAAPEPVEHKPVSSARNVKNKSSSKSSKKKSFYSESEKSSSEYSSASEGADGDDNEEDESGSEDSEEESSSGSESSDEASSDSESDSSSGSGEGSSGASSSEEEERKNSIASKPSHNVNHVGESSENYKPPAPKADRGNLDLLLDLDDIVSSGPVMTPSLGGFLSPMVVPTGASAVGATSSKYDLVGPSSIPPPQELLNKINGHGLQVNYRFTRGPHLYSAKMVSIELTLRNESQTELENVRIVQKALLPGMELNEFTPFTKLSPGQVVQAVLGVDFNDSMQTVKFELESSAGTSKVSLKSTVGELIRAVSISEATFKEEQARLRGMNEHSAIVDILASKLATIRTKMFEVTNVAAVQRPDDEKMLLFAGQTMSSKSLVLIAVERASDDNNIVITVNCEKMVIGSMLLNEIKTALKN